MHDMLLKCVNGVIYKWRHSEGRWG